MANPGLDALAYSHIQPPLTYTECLAMHTVTSAFAIWLVPTLMDMWRLQVNRKDGTYLTRVLALSRGSKIGGPLYSHLQKELYTSPVIF